MFMEDNCSAHGIVENLKAVRLEFLPPNTIHVLQPMNQENLKVHYHKCLLVQIVICFDNEKRRSVGPLCTKSQRKSCQQCGKRWLDIECELFSKCGVLTQPGWQTIWRMKIVLKKDHTSWKIWKPAECASALKSPSKHVPASTVPWNSVLNLLTEIVDKAVHCQHQQHPGGAREHVRWNNNGVNPDWRHLE